MVLSQNIQVVMEVSHDLPRWQMIRVKQLPKRLRYGLPRKSEGFWQAGLWINSWRETLPKCLLRTVSKWSHQNYCKMYTWNSNSRGKECACYVEFITSKYFRVQPLNTFVEHCFNSIVWNISRERAEWETPEAQRFFSLLGFFLAFLGKKPFFFFKF